MLVVLLASVLISRLCSVKQASAVGSEDGFYFFIYLFILVLTLPNATSTRILIN